MDEAHVLCDRVGIMDRGRLIALGTPRELVASLGAEHVVEFGVEGPPPEEGRLRALPGVHDVTTRDGHIALATAELHATVPALLDQLRDGGVALSLLTTHSATLEDVFVSLTGRHLRDG
jgi:ABC-2 type transport system ATP-binding protein